MICNSTSYHRKSIRLKGWDYSQPRAYFITICVQNRECLLGEIDTGKMILNGAGNMVEKWYLKLPGKFTNAKIDQYVIMPNHFHAIIFITAGADPCVCPVDNPDMEKHNGTGNNNVTGNNVIGVTGNNGTGNNITDVTGKHAGLPLPGLPQREFDAHNNIPSIMQWFKTMTTNEYIRNVKTNGWRPFSGKLWQRNYYDHIGRDEKELFRIRQYIKNNPMNWISDDENQINKSPGYVAMLNPQGEYL